MRESVRPQRFQSVDLVRGLVMAAMILVNDNGYEPVSYWPLRHAAWNGWTPTDMIFPSFLFLVGVTTVFSTQARRRRGETDAGLLGHSARRALLLVLLGFVVNNFPFLHPEYFRFYGVLPRIGICYFVGVLVYRWLPGWRSQVLLLAGLLLGYWALMRLVPVPGFGVPGRDIPLLDPDRNLVAWLDRHIFAAPHLYERTRDPEGLLSTLPAVGTTVLGLLTGEWLLSARTAAAKARGTVLAGVALFTAGTLWGLVFPVNKKLWTSSYVLVAAGITLLLLSVFLFVTEVRAERRAAAGVVAEPRISPWRSALLVFGTNAIAAYLLSELLASSLWLVPVPGFRGLQPMLYHGALALVHNPPFASLVYALGYVGVCWCVIAVLYRRRIFLKL